MISVRAFLAYAAGVVFTGLAIGGGLIGLIWFAVEQAIIK